MAVREIGLGDASDDVILDHAIAPEQVIISEDTDFGALLSYRKLHGPSFILLRSSDPIEPDEQARMILSNLDAIADDLAAGSIAVFARGHLRIRRLPPPQLRPPELEPQTSRRSPVSDRPTTRPQPPRPLSRPGGHQHA